MKIGIVGDLSQGDPNLFDRTLGAALAVADLVVQVGDINPGYAQLRARLASPDGERLLVIPGNHDTCGPGDWDAELSALPKQWRRDFPDCVLIGVDNSKDVFDDAARELFSSPTPVSVPLFVFAHKALTPLLLPDGTESRHIMGEGGAIPSPLASQMMYLLRSYEDAHGATLCCGHYHGSSVMKTDYATVILEGRGGAAGPSNLGYTLVNVQPDGWTAHPVTL